jgi:hypothetical protein
MLSIPPTPAIEKQYNFLLELYDFRTMLNNLIQMSHLIFGECEFEKPLTEQITEKAILQVYACIERQAEYEKLILILQNGIRK